MRAILVSVDYTDILSITLPYNRHHFEDMCIVTSLDDMHNVARVVERVNQSHPNLPPILVYATQSFYDDGAQFNKWKALEEGLDAFGRHGWLCLMDADVLWPKHATDGLDGKPTEGLLYRYLRNGYLYSPLRRMYTEMRTWAHWKGEPLHKLARSADNPDTPSIELHPYPPEEAWKNYPIHRNVNEWAGYTQIFHSSDPILGRPPWHEINWKHAGGADSMFQARWPVERKVRLPFEVLHIGYAGHNWCGRATNYLDGSQHAQGKERREQVVEYIRGRYGKVGPDRFSHEKL